MKITALYIKSFAGVRDAEVRFGDEITVIAGNNEAGKSSITAFIRFMFYGFQNKDKRNRYINWSENTASGKLELIEDGSRYSIERTAHRDSAREQVSIVDLSRNAAIPGGKSPAELFLGVPVQVYDSTAYISQMDGSRVGGKDISTAIENLLFAADENVSPKRALKKLDEARIALYYKNQKGGKLFEISEASRSVREQIETARRTQDAILRADGELASAKEAFEDAKKALSDAEARLETHNRQFTEQRYRRYAVLMREKRDTGRTYEDLLARYTFDGRPVSGEEVLKLRSLQSDLQIKSEQIESLSEEIEGIQAEENREKVSFAEAESAAKREADGILTGYRTHVAEQKKMLWSSIATFAASGLLLVLFILFRSVFGLSLGLILAAGLSLAVGVVCAAKSYSSAVYAGQLLRQHHATDEKTLDRNLDRVRRQAEVRGKRIERQRELEERRREVYDKRAISERQVEAFCARYRAKTLEDAIAAAERAVSELDIARAAASNAAAAHDAFRDANSDLDPNRAAEMPVLFGQEAELPSTEQFHLAVERARAAVDATRNRMYEAEKQVTTLSAGSQSLTALEESLAPLAREEARLGRLHAALCLACEKLEAAGTRLRASLAPNLSKTASYYMGIATDGKYTTIGVGDHLALEYRAADPNAASHSAQYLSAGTQDLAYLSLRLALIGQLYAATPPIIFDETFSRLDDGRMKCMMKILAQCARDHMQIILFTSQARDARILSEVTGFSYVEL